MYASLVAGLIVLRPFGSSQLSAGKAEFYAPKWHLRPQTDQTKWPGYTSHGASAFTATGDIRFEVRRGFIPDRITLSNSHGESQCARVHMQNRKKTKGTGQVVIWHTQEKSNEYAAARRNEFGRDAQTTI